MDVDVRHNPEASRYEISVDGAVVGVADYRVTGDRVVFAHTEIEPPMRGRGFAATLVQYALDDVRGTGRSVVPSCGYVARFIDEHPEYGDLLAA